MKHSISIYSASVVMLVLGFAGILKLFDLSEFSNSLQSWELVPSFIRSSAVVLVPAFEVSLSLLWFARIGRHWVLVGAVSMLVVFSAVYAAHLLFVGPPECRCFGLMHRFLETRDRAAGVIWRNLVLVGGLVPFMIMRSGEQGVPACMSDASAGV